MALLNATTTAAAASLVISSNAARLVRIIGHNDSSSAQYIQVHDAATLPSDAAVPKISIVAAADSNFTVDLAIAPRDFQSGIVVCNSSTLATKTIGSADCWFDAQYLPN